MKTYGVNQIKKKLVKRKKRWETRNQIGPNHGRFLRCQESLFMKRTQAILATIIPQIKELSMTKS